MKNQTKTALQVLSCYLFIAAIVYLIASFANWKLNPAYWSFDFRMASALIILVGGTISSFFALTELND